MSTYTPSLGLELITPGTQAGLWGNTTNNSLNLIDQAVTGVTPISFASASGSTKTLTDYNGAEDEARSAVLNVTGTATGSNTIIIPNKQKTYFVRNSTGQDIIVQTTLGTTPCTVGAGYNLPVFCDGNNNVFLAIVAPGAGTLTVTGGGTGVTTFGSGGFIKSSGSSNPLTASSTVSLTTEVSGTLPVANGGTGVTSFTSGGVLIGNGSGALATVTGSTAGYVLTWNGSSWQPQPSAAGGVTSISGTSPITVTGTTTPTISLSNVPVSLGGTGATSASQALANLGGYPASNPNGYVTSSALSGYATTSQLSNYMPTAGGTFTGTIVSTAWNFTPTGNSIFCVGNGSPVQIAVGNVFGFYFYSNGNAIANGTWQSASDSRIKENIAPIGATLDKVMQLKPVEFSMKADKSSTANRYGLIAQDLEQVFPYVVDDTNTTIDDAENVKAVSYTEIIPILVKAIQELKAEVDALKAAK